METIKKKILSVEIETVKDKKRTFIFDGKYYLTAAYQELLAEYGIKISVFYLSKLSNAGELETLPIIKSKHTNKATHILINNYENLMRVLEVGLYKGFRGNETSIRNMMETNTKSKKYIKKEEEETD